MATTGFPEFKDDVRTALIHLFEPDYDFPVSLYQTANVEASPGSQAVQQLILNAISAMKPSKDAPAGSMLRRYFESLHLHYNQRLTQEEVANRLHVSVRHLQRIQAEAVHLLAGRLWSQRNDTDMGGEGRSVQAADWRSQADYEFTILRESAPDVPADISTVIQTICDMDTHIRSAYGITLEVGNLQSGLVTTIHPSILRQTIISAISSLAGLLKGKTLKISSLLEGGKVKISLAGSVEDTLTQNPADLTRDILLTSEMSLEVIDKRPYFYLNIRMPVMGERTVLVVEDNQDMVYYYRRCTAGTTYNLLHIHSGKDLFPAIETHQPDIILLDVMLPDVDGWQLLTNLHERSISRHIPVVVCSVVKEEQLALALGASVYLTKPVQPERLVEALDLAYNQAVL